MNKTVYAVFKQGVYRHGCGGIFNSEWAAFKAAEKLRDGESDDYHNYIVVPFELSKITDQTSPQDEYEYSDLKEPEPTYDVGCKDLTL